MTSDSDDWGYSDHRSTSLFIHVGVLASELRRHMAEIHTNCTRKLPFSSRRERDKQATKRKKPAKIH
jgi:hypothetical protein